MLTSIFAALWKKLNSVPGLPPKPTAVIAAPDPLRNALAGLPLRYLIGTDSIPAGADGEITEVSYDATAKPAKGTAIKYCNLFDEKNSGKYGPYLTTSDTAAQYHEGQIDPKGEGWTRNLTEQFARAVAQGFQYIELDNPDAYALPDVLGAVGLAQHYGLKVIAKNPLACSWPPLPYVAHPAVVGVVVEEDALATAAKYDTLRRACSKPNLPIWFVAFKDSQHDGLAWARQTATDAAKYPNVWISYSPTGEYTSSQDIKAMGNATPLPPADATLPDASVQYAAEYASYWRAMVIKPERAAAVTSIAHRLIGFKPRYQAVEAKTGVPWYVIAVLHQRESDADFSTYLGNGEPLNRVTRLVPKGRGPFSNWEDGASDALSVDGLDKVKAWSVERIAYSCEKFNGFGYRKHGVPSAYLWSFSSVYKGGKYVSDGVWSSSAQDQQCGTMPMLRGMMDLDNSIQIGAALPPIIEPPKPVPAPDSSELHDLGHRIKRTMLAKGFPWFPDQNVVSIEGMDPNGTPNKNRPNAFDDIKMVLDGDGKIIGGPWEGTTQPGVYWTTHPMASGGAFIIALGPQACWTPGDYHGDAWRQAEDSTIMGHRDPNCTYKRQGPPLKHDNIGVHHHKGYDLPRDNIANAAAGCQVIRLNQEQLAFMALTRKCPRYLANPKGYRLTATVLEAKDVLA